MRKSLGGLTRLFVLDKLCHNLFTMPNTSLFLADGLPPSPETECEDQRQEQESPTLHLAPGPASPRPLLQQPFSADGDEDRDKSSGVGGRPQNEDEVEEEHPTASSTSSPAPPEDTSITATTTPQPVPDVIPASDVKLGESLPRRSDPNGPNSAPPQGSTHAHPHALAQKYQQHSHTHQNYHPHPHTQNPYHHYKSDELQKYRPPPPGQNYQSNGPYTNYHGGTHGYPSNYPEDHINYPNNYRQVHARPSNYQENQQQHQQLPPPPPLGPNNPRDDYNNTLNSQRGMNGTYRQHTHYDFQDYHNYKNHQHDYKNHHSPECKNQDYGTYAKHPRHQDLRLNGRLANEVHQQYSDSEITVSKGRLAHLDGEHRQEHLRRLASLNHHLHDLDKQYEMGKPLINLVDNMVKLGSLYRGGDGRGLTHDPRRPASQHIANGYDSLQFSRRIQERRIVAEDLQLQEYELAAADQADLEGKVMQLYKLDKNLHQESLTIQSLQREKKLEETAAENSRLEHEMMMLRQKIQMAMAKNSQRESGSSSETRHIESEMVRVQTLLEDLQRRRIELSHQIQRLTSANPGIEVRPSPTGVVGAAPVPARRRKSTWLETDLDAMITRDRGMDPPEPGVRANHPVYVNASRYGDDEIGPGDYPESPEFTNSDYPPPPPPPEHMRTYNHHQHLESQTSLADHFQNDSRYLHGIPSLGESKLRQPLLNGDIGSSVLGLDRDSEDNKPDGEEQQHSGSNLDISDADDRMKRYYGILPKEKPLEIKTVRIVKRESTERRKDRTTTGSKRVTIGDSLTNVTEDDVESEGASDAENEPPIPSFASRSASLPRNYGRNGPGERVSMMSAMMRTSVGNSGTMTRPSNLALKKSAGWKAKNENSKDRPMSAHEQLFGFSREAEQTPPSSPSKSDPPSPVFKSAAAQQIIKEMASEAEKHRRAVPKEKRRHFTISSSQPLALETRDVGVEEGARSRDDCDMVRALRPRNHPDVVKSTLSSRDLRFNETTIDSILGAPDKIYIPERYMPDEDDEKEPTEEERAHREQKAESIRKMLSETQTTVTKGEVGEGSQPETEVTVSSSSAFKAKLAAEKKEREHLLALNQILARQVMEKSRVVAAHNTVEPHL